MKLIDTLANKFLYHSAELEAFSDRMTGEIQYDEDELFTGEPGIAWDDESSKNLIQMPQITSAEAFDIMLLFAKAQKPRCSKRNTGRQKTVSAF